MSEFLSQIDWDAMYVAIQETLLMTVVSLVIAVILGFVLGIILYITKEDGLYPHKVIHRILDFIINLFLTTLHFLHVVSLETYQLV